MDSLPHDCVRIIISFLPLKDYHRVCRVNKVFAECLRAHIVATPWGTKKDDGRLLISFPDDRWPLIVRPIRAVTITGEYILCRVTGKYECIFTGFASTQDINKKYPFAIAKHVAEMN